MGMKNKVALVTGASKGIGRATAIALAKVGCSVVINYNTDATSASEVLKECDEHSNGNISVRADVSVQKDVTKMFEEIKANFNSLDIVVNNAGIYDEDDNYSSIESFEKIYKNNFLSCVLVNKYALEIMKQGHIINVSSVHGKLGHGGPKAIAYSSFKAALESYTKNLAKSLAPKIIVNAIAPGRVATPMWGNPNDKEQKELGKAHLINRMLQPEEIAEAIVFLVKSDAICGEVLTIDGGMSLKTLE